MSAITFHAAFLADYYCQYTARTAMDEGELRQIKGKTSKKLGLQRGDKYEG